MKGFKVLTGVLFLVVGGVASGALIDNAGCVTSSGGHTCGSLSATQCSFQNGGSCTSCGAGAPLPNKVCVAIEGGKCNPNGVSYVCGPRSVGTCSGTACVNAVQQGTCTAVSGC